MVTNKFTGRASIPTPPAVCIAPPRPPIRPLELAIKIDDDPIYVGSYTGLWLWGDHPTRPHLEVFQAEWDPGDGFINPIPDPWNREHTSGLWNANWNPGRFEIKVTVTWVDGTVAFTSVFVNVVPLPP